MFTGLIEETGTVRRIDRTGDFAYLHLAARKVNGGLAVGDSIAVDGACLTVTAFDDASFSVQAVAETLRRTTLGGTRPGDRVNLERALSFGARLGGHLVQGHVDDVGRITGVTGTRDNTLFTIAFPGGLAPFIVEKGSVAVDGVSLTVASVQGNEFTVSIIGHTLRETTFADARTGDPVNLETDIIAKYVNNMLPGGGGLSLEKLAELGY